MSIQGIGVTAVFDGELTEDQVEHIYTSFDNNFAIKSVDMATDFDKSEISFLFGVEVPEGFGESFASEVIDDALRNAFTGEDGSLASPQITENLVGAFS
jgi:hypothetical protein